MNIMAKHNYLRMSPRKVQAVCDLIRGMEIEEAQNQLQASNKKAAQPVAKLLKSAMANAEHNYNLAASQLYIKNITADKGPTLKRWQPRAFGRVTPIEKKTTHLKIVLDTKGEKKVAKPSQKKKHTKQHIETKKQAPKKKQKKPRRKQKTKQKPSTTTTKKGKRKGFFRRKSL